MAAPFRRLLTALLFVFLPIATALRLAPEQTATSGLDLRDINRPVCPCQDVYLFACGEWLSKNACPGW